jgi:sulfur-carrier protein adenylyltransferase/sulfurtransferase
MPRVHLPAPLRELTGGRAIVHVGGTTVGGALRDLGETWPSLARHLFGEDGELRGFVNIYMGEHDVKDLEGGMNTPVTDDTELVVVPSVAGGEADLTREERARYARHLALPEVGLEGQRRLRAARIAVVGAGGLGSPVSLYLAAAGVGTLGLIDFDVVDLTNLQRQVLYGTADVGRLKTEVAAERLHAANPHVEVIRHDVRLTRDNALDVLRDYDVVIDGTDNFPTRYLVNDACVLLGKPYVYGSILRFDGQVAVFDARHGPCYRCLFREPPPPGLVPDCAEGGVLGVLPGVVGSLQALEALKLVLGVGDTLVGRLAVFDGLAFRWRELRLRRNPDCPMCGENPTLRGLIDYDEFCGVGGAHMADNTSENTQDFTPEQLKQRLETGEPLVLIDVREPFEWEIANLASHGAKLIPLGELADRLGELDPDAETVLYCRSGSRSAAAVRHLRSRGFERIRNLKGGINEWAQNIDPDMPTY